MDNTGEKNSRADVEIAVIGMAGCFPGAKHIRQFWENLKNGIESLYFLSEEEMKEAGIEPAQLTDPHHVKSAGGLLKDKEYFDAAFFGYTPAEAEVMDPQVRIFHECVWSALEHAGYAPGSCDRLIGLYAGATNHFDWQALCLVTGKSRERKERWTSASIDLPPAI